MSNSESPAQDRDVRVLDPEDYAQNRRLKQIHDARDYARRTLHTCHDRLKSGTGEFKSFREQDFRESYARAVLEYAIEVEPVIVRSGSELLERELPDQDQYRTEEPVTIGDILDAGGTVNGEYISVDATRWIKRQLDRELGKIGIGLDISEDKGPAQI